MAVLQTHPNAVAVYCAASPGNEPTYTHAAVSLGNALVRAGRPLVYGGGSHGIMGVVSGAVKKAGGSVTGIIPYAMHVVGGEREKTSTDGAPTRTTDGVFLNGKHTDGDRVENGGAYNAKVQTIVVDSMHERKVEMAKRACGFVGLPGGFGTFEEVFEVITWTQIAIHHKPVILLNVLGFYEPLRMLIQNGVRAGFIHPDNEALAVFVDGPPDHELHATFDWGTAALEALEGWAGMEWEGYGFDWSTRRDTGEISDGLLGCT